MLVSPVNFSGTQGSVFQDKIRQPQAFVKNEAPVASTSINTLEENQSSHTGLKVAGAIAGTAAIATSLAAGKKLNLFAAGENKYLNYVKAPLDKVGGFILDTYRAGKDKISKLFSKGEEQAESTVANSSAANASSESAATSVVTG